jgi:hypothetical protein
MAAIEAAMPCTTDIRANVASAVEMALRAAYAVDFPSSGEAPALREALEDYGQHRLDCPAHPLDERDGPCLCGWDKSYENLVSSPPDLKDLGPEAGAKAG